jgi:hypothetical protein
MSTTRRFLLGAVCGVALAMLPKAAAHLRTIAHAMHGDRAVPGSPRAHTEERFAFTAHGPMEQVAPLFGADKERVWAPQWDPQFIQPLPAKDGEGMVFTVAHGNLNAVWVNTGFDLKNGRVQYVYTIPDHLITVITLHLTPADHQTQVEVQYDRTALSAAGDAHVREMANHDREAGSEWERQINGYLEKHPGS